MSDRHPIFDLCHQLVDDAANWDPAYATYAGIAGHDHRWPDLSPDGAAAKMAAYEKSQAALAALPSGVDRWDELAIATARDYLDEVIEFYALGDHLIDLDSMACPTQTIVEIFDHMDKSTVAGWENICERLETMPSVLAGYRTTLESAITAGTTVARRQVEAVIQQSRTAGSAESGFMALHAELADSGHDRLADRLAAAVDIARAAQSDLADWLESRYLPAAVAADGVGPARYARAARRFLGTDIDMAGTYDWAWGEVARLRARMESVAQEIAPGASIADALHILKTDPERAAATRDDFVAFMLARNADALDRLDGSHFDVPANIRTVDVKLANPGGPLGAYYVGPNEDFTRPGTVWWAHGTNAGPFPLYDEVSTLYHEGFPGHHLQVGIQMTRADRLSRLHRMLVWYAGLGEGWALYAERLVDQLGFFEKPDYVFGFLSAQILRACRVVIDIGSHLGFAIPKGQPFHPGENWTYELGVEMLQEYATLERAYAESEMTRYLGWPGQAISYKVGEKAILEIREELESRNGFDLKQFHADLLEIGPVGLDLLRDLILD